mmetsp:Transcript_57417/g.67051  ORF Transcript_57417/g.67051 Transcript_57417/m.67051 type:complete len:82 (+) Transcript_57417:433-678(+)
MIRNDGRVRARTPRSPGCIAKQNNHLDILGVGEGALSPTRGFFITAASGLYCGTVGFAEFKIAPSVPPQLPKSVHEALARP